MNLIRLLQGDRTARGGPHAHLRRHRDRLGRRRRHGRARADVARHEGADARGRQEARHQQGAEVDGVAVRAPAARRDAAGPSCAVAQRVHDPSAAVRRRLEVHQGLFLRPGLERHRLLQEHRRRREGPSVHRHELRVGAGALPRRQDEHLGHGSRCGCPTTTSRRRATTATARTGRSPTRTSSRTTTASISISGSPASRKTCRICPTACFSARRGSPPPR